MTDSHVQAVDLLDSGSHIAHSMKDLENSLSSINDIKVSDQTVLHVSAQGFVDSLDVLSKISSDLDGSGGSLFVNVNNSAKVSFASVSNWCTGDLINFNVLLNPGGNSGTTHQGLASIDQATGLATFASSDSTLAEQVLAAENALKSPGADTTGNFATWMNGADTFVLVSNGVSGSVLAAGDALLKFANTDVSHLQLHGVFIGA